MPLDRTERAKAIYDRLSLEQLDAAMRRTGQAHHLARKSTAKALKAVRPSA